MAQFLPPDGYMYDERSGLYYSQYFTEQADGSQSQVVNWFNAETGESFTNVYPVSEQTQQAAYAETTAQTQQAAYAETTVQTQQYAYAGNTVQIQPEERKSKKAKKDSIVIRGLSWMMLYTAIILVIVIATGLIVLGVKHASSRENSPDNIYTADASGNRYGQGNASDNSAVGDLAQAEAPDSYNTGEALSEDEPWMEEYNVSQNGDSNYTESEYTEDTNIEDVGEENPDELPSDTQGSSEEEAIPCIYDGYWLIEKDSKKSESELMTIHIVSSTMIEVNGEPRRAELAIGGTAKNEETWFHVYTTDGERGDLMIEANYKDIEFFPDFSSSMIEFVLDKQRMDAEGIAY